MFEPLLIRDQPAPRTLIVVRLGSLTLTDKKLTEQCARTRARWGIDGFSVLEVPGGDYEQLARVAPIVTMRPKLYEARAQDLLDAGFPLIATNDHPYWTMVCSEPTARQFAKVRAVFDGPKPNPAWTGRMS